MKFLFHRNFGHMTAQRPSYQLDKKTTQWYTNRCARESPYHESLFLLSCLEAAMTKFGGCVNELQVNLLQGPALGLHKQGLKREMPGEYAAAAAPF